MPTKKVSKADEARLKQLRPIAERHTKWTNHSDAYRKNTGLEMLLPGALDEQKIKSDAASAEIQAILAKYR